MAIVPIEGLNQHGIIYDWPGVDLPLGAWTDGRNVHFINGKLKKSPGNEAVWTTGQPAFEPWHLVFWKNPTEYNWIMAGQTEIYSVVDGTYTNITRYTTTPGDNDYSAGTHPIWMGFVFNGVPILNNQGGLDYPQQWDGTLSRMKDLDNWPVDTYCKIIRPYKNFLVALDITESTTRYPYQIKWSDVTDPGAVPSSWDETDSTNLADELPQAETGGFFVDAKSIGDSLAIYKEDSIILMQAVSGDYTFNFRTISQSVGALSVNSMQQFYRQHFVVGKDDVYIFDGVNPKSIITNKARKWFYRQLSSDYFYKTFVVPNFPDQEMWICFVKEGSVKPDTALVWHWGSDTWSVRDLPEVNHILPGVINDSGESLAFDDQSGTFDTDFGQFDEGLSSPAESRLMYATNQTNKIQIGASGYTNDGTPYTSYVERLGLPVTGKGTVDPTVRKFLRAVYPKLSAPCGCSLTIRIGYQDTPDGAVTWLYTVAYDPTNDFKVNCRVPGKYMAIRIEENANTSALAWEMSGMELDVKTAGRY